MSTNQGPEYFAVERKYLQAQTIHEQIFWLEKMIQNFKKHKGSENMLTNIKQRLKKLLEKQEKSKSVGKTTQKSIKKEGFQAVLLGLTGKGKSYLLSKLTNAKPKIDSYPFTTTKPEIGTLDYEEVKAQIIDLPSIGSDNFDLGIVNTADLIIIVINSLEELAQITPCLSKTYGKKLIALNKSDLLSSQELRKLQEKIKSKKLNAVIVSAQTNQGIEELKFKIFHEMSVIRVYTKEPGKPASSLPIVLPSSSSVKNAAESILKGFSQKVKETRLTGPSSKFPNQKVGLSHILADKDIVEFHTK